MFNKIICKANKKIFISIALLSIYALTSAFWLTGCNTTDPPINKAELLLKLEDVSCTEAWITITTNNLQLPAEINLTKTDAAGNSSSLISILTTQDSLLYVDSLLPNQTYLLKAASIEYPVLSSEITVTTMDTTSHNFTFETWTFGDIGSSTLYDVVIINENNIWAVGDIKIADTSANGYTIYNAVHWNGNEWTLKKITVNFRGNLITPPLEGIFAFSNTDIWVVGSLPIHGDGENWTVYDLRTMVDPNLSVSKAWGNNSDNIYFVGLNGSLVWKNGSQWSKIENGTSLHINDIWGDYNEKTGEWEILAVASNYGTSLEKEILQIKNNVVIKLPLSSQMWPLTTVWFKQEKQYYVAGAGIYQKKLLVDKIWKNNATDITNFSTTSIRGNHINDVVGVGAFGDFIHFNGKDWRNDYEDPLLSNGSYTKVSIKNDLLVAVGGNQISINSQAVILVGRR